MTAKHFGIMECAFFNRHGYAGVGPAYVDVGKEGVEWGLKGGRSFSLRQSCNTHTHTHVFQREMGWGQGVWHSGGVCWCVLNSLIYVREQAFVFIPWMWLKIIFVPVRLMCVSECVLHLVVFWIGLRLPLLGHFSLWTMTYTIFHTPLQSKRCETPSDRKVMYRADTIHFSPYGREAGPLYAWHFCPDLLLFNSLSRLVNPKWTKVDMLKGRWSTFFKWDEPMFPAPLIKGFDVLCGESTQGMALFKYFLSSILPPFPWCKHFREGTKGRVHLESIGT